MKSSESSMEFDFLALVNYGNMLGYAYLTYRAGRALIEIDQNGHDDDAIKKSVEEIFFYIFICMLFIALQRWITWRAFV